MRAEEMHALWLRLFVTFVLSWLIWVLATSFIGLLSRHFPPSSWRSASTWLVYISGCVVVGLAYSFWSAWLRAVLRLWGEHIVPRSTHVVAFKFFLYQFDNRYKPVLR
jgi:hypothetical protein